VRLSAPSTTAALPTTSRRHWPTINEHSTGRRRGA
jgi:hypothetical protein